MRESLSFSRSCILGDLGVLGGCISCIRPMMIHS
jgi:hypothetical protein